MKDHELLNRCINFYRRKYGTDVTVMGIPISILEPPNYEASYVARSRDGTKVLVFLLDDDRRFISAYRYFPTTDRIRQVNHDEWTDLNDFVNGGFDFR